MSAELSGPCDDSLTVEDEFDSVVSVEHVSVAGASVRPAWRPSPASTDWGMSSERGTAAASAIRSAPSPEMTTLRRKYNAYSTRRRHHLSLAT